MSIILNASTIINKLQEIIADVQFEYSSNKNISYGIIIAIAQHRVNLYLSSIGINEFIMVDCDHTGTLFLNTLEEKT